MANTYESTSVEFRGLDLSAPYDMIKKNRTPFARNFRLFAQEADDRRVAISSRKGSGSYITPLGESNTVSLTSTTGAADLLVGVMTNWKAFSFTAPSASRLTRVDINIKNTLNAKAPLVVEIHANNSGSPGDLIASSGILQSSITTSYAYVPAYFIDAPLLTNGATYWVTLKIQDEGSGTYYVSSTTAAGSSSTSDSGGNSWTSIATHINFKVYTTPDAKPLGLERYTPDNANNRTMVPVGTSMYAATDGTGLFGTAIATGLSASATNYYFTQADNKVFWVNGYDNVKTWDGTTVETLSFTNLPVLRYATFHYNRLFGVSASDPNRIVFSEAPGNSDGSGNLWYKAYLSTSIIYVPVPHANDPITAIVSFQNTLAVFTASNKYVLYGDNPGNFTLRPATGSKGAISQRGVLADKDYIYFVGDDGLYRWNGTTDEKISDLTAQGGGSVQPEFASIPNLRNVSIADWKSTIRFYYQGVGSAYNDRCLIWHKTYEEWMLDTDSYVSYALGLTDDNDPKNLVELSSLVPAAYYAEQQFSNLGKAIDFKYWLKYNSYGDPAKRKRIVKYFPLLQGRQGDYYVTIGLDRDMEDSPRYFEYPLVTGGLKIGGFKIGDGSKLGGQTSFKARRVRVSGTGYYWQSRIERNAINNPVQFMGEELSFRKKKL